MLQQKPQETATEMTRALPQITKAIELVSPLQVLHNLANRIIRYTTEGTYRTVGGADFGANFARNAQRYIQEGTMPVSARLGRVLSLAELDQQPKTTEQKKQNV